MGCNCLADWSKTKRIRAFDANCRSLPVQSVGWSILGANFNVTEKIVKPATNTEMQESAHRKNDPQEGQNGPSERVEVQPTLEGYFRETSVSPFAFFKVLRKNKVKRFQSADQEAAGKIMATQDPAAERLWALMSQSSMPEAVHEWIWRAAKSRLTELLGDAFDPRNHDAVEIFKSVLKFIEPRLHAEQKEDRKRAEIFLRLAICCLMEERSLKAWQIAERLRHVFFSDMNAASRVARRAVQKGRSRELRLAVAMTELGDQMVRVADEGHARQRIIAADLRHRLDDAKGKAEALKSDLEDARKTIADLEATIAKQEKTHAAERQHWGHDLTEARAGQKVLLGERLGPLLEDAIDALEIEPPAPGTALRRVKAAFAAIEEAKE